LLRSIDIMNAEVSRADLRIAGLKNDLSQLRPAYRKVKIRLFSSPPSRCRSTRSISIQVTCAR